MKDIDQIELIEQELKDLAKREQMLRQTLEVRKRERDIKRKLHAAQLRYSVDIEYVDKDGQRTLRTIIPAVVLDRYVEAYCFRRRQRRKFRISRIEKVVVGPPSSFADAVPFLAEGFIDALTKIINDHAEGFGRWYFQEHNPGLLDHLRPCDVLLSHGPAHRVLDTNVDGHHCGSQHLRGWVRRNRPMVHIHGHIHEAYGHERSGETDVYCVSALDEHYHVKNAPVVIEI